MAASWVLQVLKLLEQVTLVRELARLQEQEYRLGRLAEQERLLQEGLLAGSLVLRKVARSRFLDLSQLSASPNCRSSFSFDSQKLSSGHGPGCKC